MEKPFTITSFEWNKEIADKLRKAGCEAESDATIIASLIALAHFLEEHNLTKRPLLKNGQLIAGEKFALHSTDLTDSGLAVIRAGFGAWEKKGCPARDIRPLERAYRKVVLSEKPK